MPGQAADRRADRRADQNTYRPQKRPDRRPGRTRAQCADADADRMRIRLTSNRIGVRSMADRVWNGLGFRRGAGVFRLGISRNGCAHGMLCFL